MNYFLQGLLKDTKWWVGLFYLILLALSMVEILSMMFLPKPIFNGWAIGITLVACLGLLIYLFKIAYVRDKKLRQIKRYLPSFEKERREDLLDNLKAHPEFQTHCYKCKHFDSQLSACSLHLFKRTKFIKIDPTSNIDYCLYWNAKVPIEIIEDVI